MSEDNKSTIVVPVDYNNWSKEELIDKIRKLECHVKKQDDQVFPTLVTLEDHIKDVQSTPEVQISSSSSEKTEKVPRKRRACVQKNLVML